MKRRTVLPLLLILAPALAAQAPTAPNAGAGTQRSSGLGTVRARAEHGMVASTESHASRVGVEVMRKGGNAVDAAVAVGLALAVTYPAAGNLGGGGFMVVRRADGRSHVLDFRETAPKAAYRDLYLDAHGEVRPHASTVGHLAAGVPGTVAGLSEALKKWGTRPWKEMVEPARRLADEGFPVTPAMARGLRTDFLSGFPESRRVFQRDGRYYQAGETLRQPDLAATLRRLRDNGAREFYEGRTTELLVAEMRRGGGLITREDLKAYRPRERKPLTGKYRGYDLITMPPPSSGGTALIQMLNILENADLAAMGAGSPKRHHLVIEAMRRAFADRSHFQGDPDFVKVPVRGLTSRRYAQELFKSIRPNRATPSSEVRHGNPARFEREETTHYSVVDAAGNAVSVTYTLNGGYGNGVTVTGAGFLLNNEMDDFTSKPGVPNLFGLIQGEANAIAPRKRPLSSMTPTIVTRNGKLWLVIGSPGGPTIINTVLHTILNTVDHEMNIKQAIDAPRFHHQWLPDQLRHEPGFDPAARRALEAMGHRFAPQAASIGDAQGIMIDPATGTRLGASDRRSPDGEAAGY